MENDPNDVKCTKENFATDGRYKEEVKNGYIDRELDTAIRNFQHDYDLKPDGYMNPKGETETRLNAVLKERVKNNLKTEVAAPALPMLSYHLASILGMSAAAAWAHYQNQSHSEKKRLRAQVNKQEQNKNIIDSDNDPNHDECDEIYDRDIQQCNNNVSNKTLRSLCYQSANERLGKCSANKPIDEWPDLRD